MKKQILLLTAFVTLTAAAQQRSATEMMSIASKAFTTTKGISMAKGSAAASGNVRLLGMSSAFTKTATAASEAFAVFTPTDGKGFVIVSAKEKMPEVMAISEEADFSSDGNPALQQLLESYVSAAQLISEGKATAAQIFGTTGNINTTNGKIKEPILGNITFNQNKPYNKWCPTYHDTLAATGCVATSMAQVMKHYRWPAEHGDSSVNYITKTRGFPVSYSFTDTIFNWNKIRNAYRGGEYIPDFTTKNISASSFYFYEKGGLAVDTADLPMRQIIKIKYIWNGSEKDFNGYMNLIIYNTDGSVLKQAGNIKSITINAGTGFKANIIDFRLPPDIPDGTYRLTLGFSEDSVNYSFPLKSKNSTETYYTEATKTGLKYTIDGITLDAAYTPEEANAVATLMYACGAAAKADYAHIFENGAYATSASSLIAWRALHTFFRYDPDMFYVSNKTATTDQICTMAKEELDKDHIVPVAGTSEKKEDTKSSGHSFLIDGYDFTGENPLFHINWGWEGKSNSYFLINMMKPSEAGTGGMNVNYSYSYQLYMNVSPKNSTHDGNGLCAEAISVSDTLLTAGKKVDIIISKLKNLNLFNNIDDTLRIYLVSKDIMAFRTKGTTSYYATAPILPDSIDRGREWKSFEISDKIPNGTYHLELRNNIKDRFFCKKSPDIIVSGNFDLKEGDVNCDNIIDTADVLNIIDVITRKSNIYLYPRTDVNGDGTVDILDVNKEISLICSDK